MEIQEHDIEILEDSIKTVNAAATLGAETLSAMQAQTERFAQIEAGITKVEQEIKISGRYLRTLSRRMGKDKICLSLSCLAVALLIAILIYKYSYTDSPSIPEALLPQSTSDWSFWDETF